jgi:hypothetical protein
MLSLPSSLTGWCMISALSGQAPARHSSYSFLIQVKTLSTFPQTTGTNCTSHFVASLLVSECIQVMLATPWPTLATLQSRSIVTTICQPQVRLHYLLCQVRARSLSVKLMYNTVEEQLAHFPKYSIRRMGCEKRLDRDVSSLHTILSVRKSCFPSNTVSDSKPCT